jgi:hypothetical protein
MGKNGKTVRRHLDRPESEWVIHHSESLRIISDDLWSAVRSKDRKKRKAAGSKYYVPGEGSKKYVLSGILKCGICGASMVTSSYNGHSRLVCNNHWNRGNSVCENGVRIERQKVETVILDVVRQRVLQPHLFKKLLARISAKITSAKESNRLNRTLQDKINQLKREIDNLTGFVLGGDTSDSVRKLLIEKESEYKKLSQELDSKERENTPVSLHGLGEFIKGRVSEITKLINSHPDQTYLIRRYLEALFPDKVTMIPEKVRSKWGYKIAGKGFPLNSLRVSPFPTKVYVPKGI